MPRNTPDYRAMGEARLAVAKVCKTPQDWKKLWKKPENEWAMKFGTCWKACFEYRVADFAAEVGFFIDSLGCTINAFSADYAMFTSPDQDFYFAIVPAKPGDKPTPPDSVHLQFMVEDIFATALEFESRGIAFETKPQSQSGAPIYRATFKTPNGIPIDLWGMVDPKTTIRRKVEKGSASRTKVGAK